MRKKLFGVLVLSLLAMLTFIGTVHADSAKLVNPANGHSYQRFDNALAWDAAKNSCTNLGAHLATVTSQSEKDWIYQNVYIVAPRPGGNNTYLGGIKNNGVWQWITGETFNNTDWCSGEPNGNTDIAYLSMVSYSAPICFNDLNAAGDQYIYLCEWEAPAQPVLSVTPSNQAVSKDAGTTTFSVSNTGTGTMSWTAAVTSTGSWLTITSGASGTDSGTINCSFPANTSTSSRTATVRVTATGATNSPVDVTVTQAPAQPVLSVTPSNQAVVKDAGTTTFGVSNTGTGTMTWTAAATSTSSWLTITSGASGTDSGTISCSFPANTSTSARTATVRVTATGATGNPVDVTVTQAPAQPVLSVTPSNQAVSKDAGTTTFGVSNTGTGTMPWTAAVTPASTWLTITSGASGTDSGTISCNITANTSTSARTATVRVTATGATGSPVDVTVTQAPAPPVLSVTPSNRDVPKDAGSTTFSLSITGTATIPWTAAVTSGSTWLTITYSASGTNSGTITCTYTANTTTLTRIATIRVTAAGATGSPKDVTVTQAGQPNVTISGSVKTASSTGIFGVTITFSNGGGPATTDSSGNYSVLVPINYSGMATPSKTGYTFDPVSKTYSNVTTPKTGENYVGTPIPNPTVGSNSIDAIDVVKITDMSGLLPDAGGAVTVRAWDKDGKQLTSAGYASPLSVLNHGTTSIRGADLEIRFPDGAPAAYSFSVESSKMFITNVNNSIDGAVKVPIIYSNGLSNFVSNSIGPRNTLKLTDMSGTIGSAGITITVTAWDASGKAIPESTSAAPLKLYSRGTTTIAGSSLAARFLPGVPMTYEFTIASPKLVISNVKNSSDATLNIPTVYTVGISSFVSNSVGVRNTIYISDFSGALDIGGAAITVRAWDEFGTEIAESDSLDSYKIFNYETVRVTGAELASRFSSGVPMTYEFTVDSSNVVITNVKSSSDGRINIPTVYTSGITKYTTNYVSDLNTIRITDMSGSIPSGGGSITIIARDVTGTLIPESGSATALKLINHGTTTIEGIDLRNRFPGGTTVTYEFSIDSSSAIVTNLTESTDGTINIPAVFTIGPYGGI